jgi:hypothetical protein|tara:strand:+ start:2623 stop:2811 length:189 start_codon:yes stop_codon:yes gene_type:complete
MPKFEATVTVTIKDIAASNVDEAEYVASSVLYLREWYEATTFDLVVTEVKSIGHLPERKVEK